MNDIAWGKVHGFNDPSSGDDNINKDRLLIKSEGAKKDAKIVVDTDATKYGFWRLFWVRYKRHEPVSRLVTWVEKQLDEDKTVVLEMYSNGWNYGLQAIQLVCDNRIDLKPGQKILMLGVHPAGRRKFYLPDCVQSVEIWITKSDWIVRLATYASFLRLTPKWGRLGYKGPKTKDPRIGTRDLSNIAKGHGGAYHDHILEWGAKEKVEWVLAQLET
jgi:hypothetical protein